MSASHTLNPALFLKKTTSALPLIAIVVAVSAAALGAVLFIHVALDVPIGDLTRDPAAVLEFSFYIGFLSQLGIFFWSASATACFLGAIVVKRNPEAVMMRPFLLASGAVTLMLGLDDVFLLHEVVFPHFGIPEKAVFAGYAGIVLLYLTGFRSIILRTEFVLLGAAFAFFALSMGLDVLELPGINPYLLEDGAKFFGIVSWMAYSTLTAISTIRRDGLEAG